MICENISTLKQSVSLHPVQIIAITKSRPVADIVAAFECGVNDIGENYLQEAIPKIEALQQYPITWHYVGHLQTNKLKAVAQYFSVVHSLYRLDQARKLNRFAATFNKKLQVYIQLNLDDEPQKGGIAREALHDFLTGLEDLKNLEVLGLMLIPKPAALEITLLKFKALKEISMEYGNRLPQGLSMGMSADYLQAVEAGATCVRLGTAIFGPRRHQKVLGS